MEIKIKKQTFLIAVVIAAFIVVGLFFLRINSLEHPSTNTAVISHVGQSSNLWAIFLTGLFVGGLTCMAVQGGLLAATIAQREEERLKEKARKGAVLPIISFLMAKLAAYTVLGFLLGWLGSAFQLSLGIKTILNFAVVVFMIGTAFNILNVHPNFRYFVIQ